MRSRRPLVLLVVGAAVLAAPGAAPAAVDAGDLLGFGDNGYGQLALPMDASPHAVPSAVVLPGATGPVTQAAIGGVHGLAVTSTGQLYAWGGDGSGQLGVPGGSGPLAPVLVTLPGATGPPVAVAAGYSHSLVLTATHQLYAFGANSYGQLGNTNSGTTPTPTLVSLPFATGVPTKIAAGEAHSLVVTSTGELFGFGSDRFGQIARPVPNPSTTPMPVPKAITVGPAGTKVADVAAGQDYSMALTTAGHLYGFGDNTDGELGPAVNPTPDAPNPTPTLVTLVGDPVFNPGPLRRTVLPPTGFGEPTVVQVACGAGHTVALTTAGDVYTFGRNDLGELGRSTSTASPNPTPGLVPMPAGAGPVTQIAAGWLHSLVVTSDGRLLAFGLNDLGQLGSSTNLGTINPVVTPSPAMLPPSTTIDAIAKGSSAKSTLALVSNLAVPASLPRGRAGSTYTASVVPTGGTDPVTTTVTGLPAGLAFDAAQRRIAGTPAAAGTTPVSIVARDMYGSVAARTVDLVVDALARPSGGGGGGGSTAPGPTGAVGATTPAPAALHASLSKLAVKGRTLRVTIACAGGTGQPCTGTIAVTARTGAKAAASAKKKAGLVTVASKAYTVPSGQTRVITVSLNAKGRTSLTRLRRLPVIVTVRATGATAPLGTATATLRSAAKRNAKAKG